MNDAALVRVLQRRRNLQENGDYLEVSGTAQAPQIATGGELHWKRNHVSRTLWGKDLEDRRVIEATRDLVFTL